MDESIAEHQQPLSVRVLLPDGGELEPPEEQEAEEDGSAEEAAPDEQEPVSEEREPEEEADEPAVEEDGERAEAEAEDGTRILHLHLDRVFLDLLGLEVDLDEVTLDITARRGEGNLLGNLLSAVGGLLDGSGLGDITGDGSLLSLPSLGLPSMPELPNPMERARELASALADRIREVIGDAIAALPLEEFFTELFQTLVDQLINGGENGNGNGNGDGDAEPA